MQFEFQGHPPSGRHRKFGGKKVWKRSVVSAERLGGVCDNESAAVFRGRRRARGPGDPEQQREEV